ncbi:MAG: methane monooxygenase/ammonia monooxygenase subunit C [Gammaproteobacteria bacterium]|jgi:methane/ammonia monooxygenase subunit C
MSSTTASLTEISEITADEAVDENGIPWSTFFKVIIGIAVVYGFVRVYMHAFAYTMGLDYFEPEFATFWMSVFWLQAFVCTATFIGAMGYLWVTRERSPETVAPEVELSRYFKVITWLVGYTAVVLILGPLAGESDAAWHQVVIRDTDFTPTHISLFYLGFPALIIFGVGSFVYAKTRLPMHAKKSLVPLGIAIGGPILVLPTVGLNEWGHTFFYAEELFGAPIHYGFAALGLALLALGGVVVHLLLRMKELIDIVTAEEA